MNLTISSNNIRNHFKSRYVVSLAGAALAFCALAGASGSLEGSDVSSPVRASGWHAAVVSSYTQPLFANAADAEQAGNVAALESGLPVTSHDADIMASVVSSERAAYGDAQRAQPQFANAADAEQAGNVAALEGAFPVTNRDADIMASVLSTERATWK